MTVKQAIELFGSHRQVQVRQNTRDGYRYLIRNFEALFGDSPVEAVSSEDIYQFLLILTEGRTKVSARFRYAQVKAFFLCSSAHKKNNADTIVMRSPLLASPANTLF